MKIMFLNLASEDEDNDLTQGLVVLRLVGYSSPIKGIGRWGRKEHSTVSNMAAQTVGFNGGSLSSVEITDRARTKMKMFDSYIVDNKK